MRTHSFVLVLLSPLSCGKLVGADFDVSKAEGAPDTGDDWTADARPDTSSGGADASGGGTTSDATTDVTPAGSGGALAQGGAGGAGGTEPVWGRTCDQGCGTEICIENRCERDLIAYFRFDEGSGTTTTDSVQGLVGTLAGDASWDQGRVGTALHFDGDADVVEIAGFPDHEVQYPISISAWIFLDVGAERGLIFSSENVDRYCGVRFLAAPDYVSFITGSCASAGVTARRNLSTLLTEPIPIQEWSHLALTAPDPLQFQMYLQGQLVNSGVSGDYEGFIVNSPDHDAVVGSGSWTKDLVHHFKGRIDELRVYGRTLSATEVGELYENP